MSDALWWAATGTCHYCGQSGVPIIPVSLTDAPAHSVIDNACGVWTGRFCGECHGMGCYIADLCPACYDEEPYDPDDDPKIQRLRSLRARARAQGWKVNTDGARTKLTDPTTGEFAWYDDANSLEAFLA